MLDRSAVIEVEVEGRRGRLLIVGLLVAARASEVQEVFVHDFLWLVVSVLVRVVASVVIVGFLSNVRVVRLILHLPSSLDFLPRVFVGSGSRLRASVVLGGRAAVLANLVLHVVDALFDPVLLHIRMAFLVPSVAIIMLLAASLRIVSSGLILLVVRRLVVVGKGSLGSLL